MFDSTTCPKIPKGARWRSRWNLEEFQAKHQNMSSVITQHVRKTVEFSAEFSPCRVPVLQPRTIDQCWALPSPHAWWGPGGSTNRIDAVEKWWKLLRNQQDLPISSENCVYYCCILPRTSARYCQHCPSKQCKISPVLGWVERHLLGDHRHIKRLADHKCLMSRQNFSVASCSSRGQYGQLHLNFPKWLDDCIKHIPFKHNI